MLLAVILGIGISQSLFAAVLMYLKQPINLSDKILGNWFIATSFHFTFNMLVQSAHIDDNLWPIFLPMYLSFPQFLFLYTKYTINNNTKFYKTDFLHFIPALFVFITLLIAYAVSEINSHMSFTEYFKDYQVTKHILGAFFIILLWIYSIYSICLISKYKKQICSLYSFNSYKNNLNWLLVVVISFLTTYNSIVVSSFFNTLETTTVNIELYRSGVILFFIYVVSIGGLKQQKLIIIDEQKKKTSELDKDTIFMGTDSEKYTRSSLKLSQVKGYVKCLVDYMNNSKAWKDQELSIAKLSSETGIPKHHITQILNENLQKNFYTFVNEYRTEQAKLLIASPKYENWSFVAIAYECGFNSKTAFNTFFKKYTNMTPTEYKKMILEKTT